MLFPFHLLRQFSPAYRTSFDWLFHTDVSHIVARFIFYGVLTWLASAVFSNKKPLVSCFILIIGALSIAVAQEVMQLFTGQGPVGWDDVFDTIVDVSGAAIGIFIFRWRWNKKNTDHLTN